MIVSKLAEIDIARIFDSVQATADDAHRLLSSPHLARTVARLDTLSASMNRTVNQLEQTAQHLNPLVKSAHQLVAADGRISNQVDATLKELAAAARSLRRLSDQISRDQDRSCVEVTHEGRGTVAAVLLLAGRQAATIRLLRPDADVPTQTCRTIALWHGRAADRRGQSRHDSHVPRSRVDRQPRRRLPHRVLETGALGRAPRRGIHADPAPGSPATLAPAGIAVPAQAGAPTYDLQVDILRFERRGTDRVELWARWTLRHGEGDAETREARIGVALTGAAGRLRPPH